ncbi:MAG TPA: ATP cone domain-containing protein [Methanoregulaceae archaeon]|nr:ATP cone domain-containing protein [Methanoregulaceae archaeon]
MKEETMVQVIKRDGRREAFTPEKIVVSALKTGASPEIARSVAHDVERAAQDGITTKDFRSTVLSMLKTKNPEWERNWIVYDLAVKKRAA